MIITITGKTCIDVEHPDSNDLDKIGRSINGAKSANSCVAYLGADFDVYGLSDGHIELTYDQKTQSMGVVTRYVCANSMPQNIIDKLVARTQAQWSDGLGAGCFDELCERFHINIDLCPLDADGPTVQFIDEEKTSASGKSTTPNSGELSRAARNGNSDEVRRLLDSGADIEELYQDGTPLIGAVLAGHVQVALELIDRGANIDFQGEYGDDALICTALSNKLPDDGAAIIAEVLLRRGVDPNKMRDGMVPLEVAIERDKSKLVSVLKAHGAVDLPQEGDD